jgi:hypothetical protein
LHKKRRATPSVANRVLDVLGAFSTFAEREGSWPEGAANPCHQRGLSVAEVSRERFLKPAEITKLGAALKCAEETGLPPAPTRRNKPKAKAKRARPTRDQIGQCERAGRSRS